MRTAVSNKNPPFVFKLALALMAFLMLTLHLTGGLYARYTTTASGSDSARVARFDFTIYADLATQFQNLSLNMAPGDQQMVQIQVHNKGEVALRCVVTAVNLTGNLPLQIEGATGDLQEGDEVVVSRDIGIGDDLTFDWKVVWPTDDPKNKDVGYMGKMDMIRITVAVEQVD